MSYLIFSMSRVAERDRGRSMLYSVWLNQNASHHRIEGANEGVVPEAEHANCDTDLPVHCGNLEQNSIVAACLSTR